MIDVSIVIVSYNVKELLAACLRSIAASKVIVAGAKTMAGNTPSIEVIVVDSASSDGTVETLRLQFDWVQFIEPGQNVGFSRGTNVGINASAGRYLLLLNPDSVVGDTAIGELFHFLEVHPRVGVVGPRLENNDHTIQSSRRRFPTVLTAFFESTWLQSIAPRRLLTDYYFEDKDASETQMVDWVTGAALLVRRGVIEEIGLLDEGFFMYSEELDWQRRIKSVGWEVAYYPVARIIHFGGKSSDQVTAQTHIAYQTSKIRYFRKHHGVLAALAIRAFLLVSYACQLLLELVKASLGHKRTLRLSRVKVYWRALQSGFTSH